MDRRDDWRERDSRFFDATCTSQNEWNIDTSPCSDDTGSDARRAGHSCRIMVIGFGVIRL